MTNDIFVDRLSALVEEKIEYERDKAAKLSDVGTKKKGKKQSFNRKSIAEELNIDYTTFLSYLKTEMSNEKKTDKIPNGKTLATLAEYFDVSVDYLLGLSDTKTRDMEIAAIGDYTGLTKEAIEYLHLGRKFLYDEELMRDADSIDYSVKIVNRLLAPSTLLQKMEDVARTIYEVKLELETGYEKEIHDILEDEKGGGFEKKELLLYSVQLDALKKDILIALFEVDREIEDFFENGFKVNEILKRIENLKLMLSVI